MARLSTESTGHLMPGGGPNSPIRLPPQVLGGGIVILFADWLYQLKETVRVVAHPIAKCKTLAEAFWTYINLDNTQYLGIEMSVGFFALTTVAVGGLIVFAVKLWMNDRKPPTPPDGPDSTSGSIHKSAQRQDPDAHGLDAANRTSQR